MTNQTEKLNDQWHKVLALVMGKLEINEIVLVPDDFSKYMKAGMTICAHETNGELKIKLLTNEQAEALATEIKTV